MVTGIGQLAFHDKANGSIIERNGKAVGSSLIGQAFTDKKGDPLPQYFQSRAVGRRVGVDGHDGGRVRPDAQQRIEPRADEPRLPEGGRRSGSRTTAKLNGLAPDAKVPVDAVTASGSGLDPAHLDRQRAAAGAARRRRARDLASPR